MLKMQDKPLIQKQFQSAPAIAGGRCAGLVVPQRAQDVSIRARHCWRAMLPGRPGRLPCPPVSIRARHCWRAMPCGGCRCRHRCVCFNPRPPLLAGDAPHGPVGVNVGMKFQSAPAIAGGRCCAAGSRAAPSTSFNPRPPLLAGDAPVITHSPHHHKVSIRARHCWRAMLVQHRVDFALGEFQSAPAIAGGRCVGDLGAVWRTPVSIRARHCWRAMRPAPGARTSTGQFQSAPAIAGGRCSGPW